MSASPDPAILVGNNRKTEMTDLDAIKTLLFALKVAPRRLKGIILNKDLAIAATGVVRDFAADFLGAFESAFFGLIR